MSRIGEYLFSTKTCPQHTGQVCCARPVPWVVHRSSRSMCAAPSCCRTGTPRSALHSVYRRGTCYIKVLPHPGSGASKPAVLGWSTPSSAPPLPVSEQPRAAMLMLHPGRRRPLLACGALFKNVLHMLRPAHQDRPVPRTDRTRRAFPQGKASTGCAAPLVPPCAPRCGHGRGPGLFRRLRGPRTAAPQPARAPG